jgi:hypothetical protein
MPQIRVTSRSGSIPTVSQLSLGDIAVNIYDGRAFLKKQVGATQTIVEIGGSSISSSYALSSSYAANGGVTQLIAGTNITLSPADGKGIVTINASAGGGGSGVPNGPNYSLQYNNGGNFSGSGNFTLLNNNALYLTGSLNISGSTFFTGSVSSLNGFTGSLFGTSSWAISASRAISSSYSFNATSASYALSSSFALSSSYAANGGVTQLLAGANISLSPSNGLGQVTITSTGGSGGTGNTATGSYGSFYDTTTQTNPVGNIPRSMSFNTTDITNGVSISGSTSPFNTYIKTQNAGVYDIQFSAQLDKTDFGTDVIIIWLRKNGSDLTDTATTVSLVGNNAKNVSAWNWFVNSAANDYYQIIWQSADTNIRLFASEPAGGHPGIPSVIVTVNRVDQFLSNTGSFSGSFIGLFSGSFTGSLFGTSSWSSNAVTASYVILAQTASFVTTAQTASYVLQSVSASFATSASTVYIASNSETDTNYTLIFKNNAGALDNYYQLAADGTNGPYYNPSTNILGGVGGITISGSVGRFTSITGSSITGSFTGSLLGTASFAISSSRAVSSSFALSASYAPDATFPYTGSALITGSLEVTGSLTVNTPAGDIDLTSTNIILNAGTLRAPLLPSSTPLPGAVLNTVLVDTLNGTLYVTSSLPGGGGGGGGTPGGATNTIQFNNAGAFSGSGNFTLVGGNTVLLTGSLNTSGSLNITGSINVRGQVLVTGSITATGSLNSNGANALNLGSNNFSVKTITLGQIETVIAAGASDQKSDTNTITLNRNLDDLSTATHTQINFDGRYWEYFPGPDLYDAYADTGNHYLKFTSVARNSYPVYGRVIDLQFSTRDTGSGVARGFSTNYSGTTYFNITGSVSASSYYGDGSNLNNLYTTPVLFNAQTSNYSASLSDLGKMVELTGSSPISIYIPPNSVTAFPTGSQITFIQTGTQVTTFVTGSGVTLNSYNNLRVLTGRYSVATCVKKSTDTWYLFGDLS